MQKKRVFTPLLRIRHFSSFQLLLLTFYVATSMAPHFEIPAFPQTEGTNTTHDESSQSNDTDDAIAVVHVFACLCIWGLTKLYFEFILNRENNEGLWALHFRVGAVYPRINQHESLFDILDAEYERGYEFPSDEALMALLPQ